MAAVSLTARTAATLLLLGGCKLVDQTTFNPEAGRPPAVAARPTPPAPAPPALSGPTPLLTVRGEAAPFDDAVRDAVTAARAVRRDVAFDVITVVAADGTPGEQAARARDGAEGAVQVAALIVAQGVPSGRVRLGARTERGITEREVRVYVR